MNTPHIEMRYFETYYFANVVHGVLEDAENYLPSFEGWGGDLASNRFLEAYPRWSHLHSFSAFLIDSVIDERVGDANLEPWFDGKYPELWIDRAMQFHGIAAPGFEIFLKDAGRARKDASEDDVYDYHQELMLTGELETLINHITEEVFQIIFMNRGLLATFNNLVSTYVASLGAGCDPRLAREGVLKRVNPPMWAKRAVYYRDRGRCTLCNRDLTGLVTLQNSNNFDHIISLGQSGLNDVSNLQLLCVDCNSKKSDRLIAVSSRYERWYEIGAKDIP